MWQIEKGSFRSLLVAALGLSPCIAAAQEPLCKGSPEVRECRWILGGVVNMTASAGIVLWTDDEWPTDKPRWRVLGKRDMPPEMYEALDKDMLALLHGDFEACFHKEWDHAYNRESVCIESVKNLVAKPLND